MLDHDMQLYSKIEMALPRNAGGIIDAGSRVVMKEWKVAKITVIVRPQFGHRGCVERAR